MRHYALFMLALFLFPSGGEAHAANHETWDVIDLSFRGSPGRSNPFTVDFGAVITHESGMKMKVPGFYNGNNSWIVRFSPPEPGRWTYTTWSEVRALNSQKGELKVAPSGARGPVRIAENNRQRLAYSDGTPYFSLAFEIDWLFALDADNPRDIPRTRQIVGHIAENGFNKAIINVYAYDAGWGEKHLIDPRFNFAKPDIFPFGGTNEIPDHGTLNIDFFKHFDRVMHELNDKGVIAHLMIYVWNKFVNWPSPGSDHDNMYFDYVVKRYQAYPNLIWDISKEALAYGMDDMDYITGRIDRLRDLDAHKRLVTVHDYSYCRAHPDKIDFISVQEWKPNLYNEMLDIVQRFPQMPVYNVEHGGYEQTMHTIFHGAYTNPEICLKRTYVCYFAGTYPTYYWQNASWYELVYDPFSLPAENQPKFHYYRHLMDFFSNFDYNTLVPAQYFYSSYVLTNNKDTFIYLLPWHGYSLEGMAPRQARGKKVEIQWFDPLTGEYSEKTERQLGEWTGIRKPGRISSPFALAVIKIID
jgi:hypothetical protein